MTSETAGAPVELFPALLYCWLWWWRKQVTTRHRGPEMPSPPKRRGLDYGVQHAQWLEQVMELRRHPVQEPDMPVPPEQLGLVEDGQYFAVQLGDFELTTWPDLPGSEL